MWELQRSTIMNWRHILKMSHARKGIAHVCHSLQHTCLRSVGEPSCPKFNKIEYGMLWPSSLCLAWQPIPTLPCSADLPQGLSWSGRSQYRRNSVGRPSGLRSLSYMPQSDSTKQKEKIQWPWNLSFSSPGLQTWKHIVLSGTVEGLPTSEESPLPSM